MSNKKIMLGNEAIARGAYEAGVKVTSAYPGTPSTEVSENVVKYKEIYAEWAPNEKVATEVAIGASMAGVRSMTMMKMVGLNVASDPLFTAGYIGVNGGMVLVVADDPGIYSSQNEQDTRMIARAAMVPVVEPSDSEEARYFTKRAYELSEKYDTPVILRTTTRLAHSQGIVNLEDRVEVDDKPYERNIAKNVMMPGNAIKRHVIVEQRLKQMAEDACDLDINKVEYNDTKIGVITSGIPYQYVKEALPNIAMQIAAMSPQYVSREDISDEELAKMREITIDSALNDVSSLPKPIQKDIFAEAFASDALNAEDKAVLEEKQNDKYLFNFLSKEAIAALAAIAMSKKEAIMTNKIFNGLVEGRISKQLKEVCLLDQTYVMAADGKQTVKAYLAEVSKEVGATVALKSFVRFETGEGIEKKEEDFAAEVAKQMQ